MVFYLFLLYQWTSALKTSVDEQQAHDEDLKKNCTITIKCQNIQNESMLLSVASIKEIHTFIFRQKHLQLFTLYGNLLIFVYFSYISK